MLFIVVRWFYLEQTIASEYRKSTRGTVSSPSLHIDLNVNSVSSVFLFSAEEQSLVPCRKSQSWDFSVARLPPGAKLLTTGGEAVSHTWAVIPFFNPLKWIIIVGVLLKKVKLRKVETLAQDHTGNKALETEVETQGCHHFVCWAAAAHSHMGWNFQDHKAWDQEFPSEVQAKITLRSVKF